MVVGNGLMAKAFHAFKDNNDILIFASGVSNSKSQDQSGFDRELNLLTQTIKENPNKKVVYFSTTSVKDEELQKTLYVQHKIHTEKFIAQHTSRYTIFRLSEVVGNGGNKSTIMNFLYNAIMQNKSFDLWANACRRVIDVNDVYEIANEVLSNNLYTNEVVNISVDKKTFMEEYILVFESLLNKKASYTKLLKGNCFDIDLTKIQTLKSFQKINNDPLYNEKVLKKYFHNEQ
jgi:nucleoside-diphosphate-sugar epimerase